MAKLFLLLLFSAALASTVYAVSDGVRASADAEAAEVARRQSLAAENQRFAQTLQEKEQARMSTELALVRPEHQRKKVSKSRPLATSVSEAFEVPAPKPKAAGLWPPPPELVDAELAYFSATWCGACKRFEERVLSSPAIQRQRIRVRRLFPSTNADDLQLAREHGVRAYPALFLIKGARWIPLNHGGDAEQFLATIRSAH